MMDFSLNEEQKQIKALVRQFCEREVDQKRMEEILRRNNAAARIKSSDEAIAEIKRNFPYDVEEKAYNAGLHHIGIPTKYGGPGPDTDRNMAYTIAKEEAGYSAGLAAWFIVPAGSGLMAGNPYLTEEQREQSYQQLIKSGYSRVHAAYSITEPGGSAGGAGDDQHFPYDEGGSDIMRVTARKDGSEWVLNGNKMFSNNGAIADVWGCAARTKEGPVSESVTQFGGIPVDTPGLTRILNKLIFIDFGGNCQWFLDNVRVPESAIVGQLHNCWKETIGYGYQHKWQIRIPLSIGMLQRLYEHMRDYAKQKIGGGRPIIEHTACAERLGDLATRLDSLKLLLYKTAWENDQMEKYIENGGTYPPSGSRWGNWYWSFALVSLEKQTLLRFIEAAHDIYGSIATAEDLPLSNLIGWALISRGASLTLHAGLTAVSRDYDNRYYYDAARYA